MRCKKHPSDLSSTVGVCSTCLRERLFSLISAQSQAQAQVQAQSPLPLPHPPPPHLPFPRSVSPYVSRRKSDLHHRPLDYRSYSTPQLGPTFSATLASLPSKRKSHSFFSKLFSSRSVKHNPDLIPSNDPSVSSRSSSSSWYSNIFSTSRKKQSRFHRDQSNIKPGRIIDRGMSPERPAGLDEDGGSGYSSESSWKRTPASGAAGSTGRRGRTIGNNVSGLAFCLSPLVRASPNRHWNHMAGLPPDKSFSGDFRGPIKPHLANAASFCANRSRKLADFGRPNNR